VNLKLNEGRGPIPDDSQRFQIFVRGEWLVFLDNTTNEGEREKGSKGSIEARVCGRWLIAEVGAELAARKKC